MKQLITVATLLLLSGCVYWSGPAHGLFYAVGSPPGNAPCQLSAAAVGGRGSTQPHAVAGPFRESIIISPSRKGHRITLNCDDRVVAERHFKYGRDVRPAGELLVDADRQP